MHSSNPTPRDPVETVLERLSGVKAVGDQWQAKCPAHDDAIASLGIKRGDDGQALIICRAGCPTALVVQQLGLKMSDLFVSEVAPANHRQIATIYQYSDDVGEVVAEVVRYKPKDFRQRRPDGKGGYIWSTSGIEVPLYNLPAILNAKEHDESPLVFVVEGEKDADALGRLGHLATCNIGGAGKWKDVYGQTLAQCRVVIIADNDKPGENHAQQVAKACYGIAASVKIVRLPGVPTKGDASDWIAAGGTSEKLLQLVESATEWLGAGEEPPLEDLGDDIRCTDLGNARRFVKQNGRDVRYVHHWKKWLVWDGTRWRIDESGAVERLAKKTATRVLKEIATCAPEKRTELVAWAKRSESAERINAMLRLARSEAGIPIAVDDLDRNLMLFNVVNGTIDLVTGQIREHRREDLITKRSNVTLDPSASHPRWTLFLTTTFNESGPLIAWLQKFLGYCLTGLTTEQCLALFYGVGRNGKTTLIEAIRYVLGEYACKADFATFLQKKGDTINNDVAALRGHRVVSASEVAEGRHLSEQLVKELTGGEVIRARFLYSEGFEFVPEFKLIFCANHRPVIRGMDLGMWRRIKCVPFLKVIPEAEVDRKLPDKLRAEASGILNWLVEGCLAWQREGLGTTPEVDDANREYKKEMDEIAGFIKDRCFEGKELVAMATPLYIAYRDWCVKNGEISRSQKWFGTKLGARGYVSGSDSQSNLNLWKGIGLRPPKPPDL